MSGDGGREEFDEFCFKRPRRSRFSASSTVTRRSEAASRASSAAKRSSSDAHFPQSVVPSPRYTSSARRHPGPKGVNAYGQDGSAGGEGPAPGDPGGPPTADVPPAGLTPQGIRDHSDSEWEKFNK